MTNRHLINVFIKPTDLLTGEVKLSPVLFKAYAYRTTYDFDRGSYGFQFEHPNFPEHDPGTLIFQCSVEEAEELIRK